uniref:Protein kinase domain-containing protein n=1 Tax=Plectus sambesii TaxID=2011161 RepID=A0A914XJG8_9BILA
MVTLNAVRTGDILSGDWQKTIRAEYMKHRLSADTTSDDVSDIPYPLIVPGPRSLRPDTGNGSSHIGGSGSTPMVPLQPRQSPRSSSSKTTGANGLDRFAIGPERIDSDWNPLGSGVFGGVYLTKAYGVKHGEDCSLVLVKTLTSKDDHVHQQFREELDLFAKSNHENVAGLLGICREQDPIIVLFDYVTWGNVKHYMVWSRNRTEGPAPLNEAQIVSISYQVAQGMEHISDQRFVHKDLAARNILIGPGIADPSMRSQPLAVKISSLSLQEDTFMLEYHTHRNQVLPVRWLAPEVLADDDYSMKSDVWSFGVLLWELYSCGEMPYQLLSNDDVIREVQSSQLTLDVRECLPEAASDLMRSCWHSDPRHRPTFTDIRDITGQLHVETGL